MYTVFQTRIGANGVPCQIQHFENLNRARLTAMRWGMEAGNVAGINIGQFDADSLPIETDEVWGPSGRIFTSNTL